MVVVGVLALQGDHRSHCRVLDELGVPWRHVRAPADMRGIDGLLLPGGESTTMRIVAERSGLWASLAAWVRAGRPTMGTCAGCVLMAQWLPAGQVCVLRNAYGPQRASFARRLGLEGGEGEGGEVLFIRAPLITGADGSFAVLARDGRQPPADGGGGLAAVMRGAQLLTTFHAELVPGNTAWHRRWLSSFGVPGEEAQQRHQ